MPATWKKLAYDVNVLPALLSPYAVGDLLYADSTTTLAKLADVAVGSYLASGGVGAAPAWATLNQAAVAGLTTADGPSFAHLHLADVAAIYTAAESWIGPSSTTGVYFKSGNVGIGTTTPGAQLTLVKANSSGLTDFLINPTAKTSGYLVDLQVGGGIKLRVAYNGETHIENDLYVGGVYSRSANGTLILGGRQNNATAGDSVQIGYNSAYTNTTGVSNFSKILTTYNQASGDATNTDLLIKRVETAIGSGSQYLIRGQAGATGATDEFWVTNIGGGYFAGNVGIGTTAFGTSAAKVLGLGSGTAPSTSPADMAQMWVADIGAVAGKAGFHIRNEDGTTGPVAILGSSSVLPPVNGGDGGTTASASGPVTVTTALNRQTYVATGAVEYDLPTGDLSAFVAVGAVPLKYTFVKTGADTLTIDPGAGNFIANGIAAAKLYDDVSGETYATVTLQLISSAASVNKWVIVGAHGTWSI